MSHCLLCPSLDLTLIMFFSFFLYFHSFCPFLSHPVKYPHCSHLSIYAYFCHVLRSPLTVLPIPSFLPCFPCASLHLSHSAQTHSVFHSQANHYSLSFVSSDAAALCCKLNPSPSFAHPVLLFLSHSAFPAAGWGGRLGALLLPQTLCWAAMLLLCCWW